MKRKSTMKRLLHAIAILMIAGSGHAQDESVPAHVIYGDVLNPQREFYMRDAAGSTPTVRLYTLADGESWASMTNGTWGGKFFYYGEDWAATNWVEVTSSAAGSNWVDYAFDVAKTATNGQFIAQVVVTNDLGKIYRFGPGRLFLDYVPPLLYGGIGLDLTGGGAESDPIFGASAAAGIDAGDIASWDAKQDGDPETEHVDAWAYLHGNESTDQSWRLGWDPTTTNIHIQVRLGGSWSNSVQFLRP